MCTSANPDFRRPARTATAIFAGLLVAACAVGPDFHRPAPPRLDNYGPASQALRLDADDAVQTVRLGAPTDPAWWRLFGSPALDDLVDAGLAHSPTLTSALEALQQSQALARAGAGVFFPAFDVTFNARNARLSPLQFGGSGRSATFNLYTLTGAVSYVIDLFGGERRAVEALGAQADRQRQAVGAARLLLTGSIVNTAVARAGYADEVETLGEIVRLETAQRDALTAEHQAGLVAWSAVLQAEQQLAADRADLADARLAEAAATNMLKTLIGREPGEDTPPPPALGDLQVPAEAPVSLPSQIVRQRPDVLQAEAVLHQASAEVGVATAALFPSITLDGSYGGVATALSRIDDPRNRFWSVGPTVDAPIFSGGARWFGRRAAQAAYRQAQADYRQTVLSALQQVADSLRALQSGAEIAAADRDAYEAANLSAALADVNRQAGLIADVDQMTSEVQAGRARLDLISARAQRLQNVVALYVASGGGWDGRPLSTDRPAEPE